MGNEESTSVSECHLQALLLSSFKLRMLLKSLNAVINHCLKFVTLFRLILVVISSLSLVLLAIKYYSKCIKTCVKVFYYFYISQLHVHL